MSRVFTRIVYPVSLLFSVICLVGSAYQPAAAISPAEVYAALTEVKQTLTKVEETLEVNFKKSRHRDGKVLGVSTDASGYTIFTPSSDTRVIYVSSSQGNDANDGLSPQNPKRTIAAGKAAVRYGYPDWLLLRKGDVWTEESIGALSDKDIEMSLGGRSPSEMMLVSSYGNGPRPVLQKSTGSFISAIGNNENYPKYLAIVGLEFYAYKRDPDNPQYDASLGRTGVSINQEADTVLFEDNHFSFVQVNILNYSDTPIQKDITLRKNVFTDSYSVDSHSQCIFIINQVNIVIEYNVFDNCGWNDKVSGAHSTIYNRSAYLSDSDGNTIYRGNIDTNGASGGVQNRTGGIVEDNLFLKTPISVVVANHSSHGPNNPNIVRNNVTLGSRNIDTQPQGTGINVSARDDMGPVAGYVEVYGNIVAHNDNPDTANVGGIKVSLNGLPVTNYSIHDNIVYDWPGNGVFDGYTLSWLTSTNADLTNVSFVNNILQQPRTGKLINAASSRNPGGNSGVTVANNTLYSNEQSLAEWRSLTGDTTSKFEQVPFLDPNRTIETYMNAIGIGGGYDEFVRRARQQSKDAYDPRITAAAVNGYIREGFQITGEVADTDNDGVSDTTDNCPLVYNASQVDSDKDGVGDACDSTPDGDVTSVFKPGDWIVTTDVLNVRQVAGGTLLGTQPIGSVGTALSLSPTRSDGYTYIPVDFESGVDGWVADAFVTYYNESTPDPTFTDTDTDGVADTADNCPNVANANQADNDNDGIGNACDSTPDGDTIGGGAGATTLETRVSSRYDDAEEFLSNNAMYLTSSDLELTAERSQQLIGLRFTDLSIPQGAVITNAYIQFQADETGRTSTNLTIAAHDTNSASAFSNDSGDISQRPRTTARATWQPPAWNTVGEAGSAQRTTNLAAVVQEVVNRSGWNSGNDMAFIISGTGKRVAESYEGSSTGAPLLHVEYQTATDPTPTDTDTDGVADTADNCPNVANANQADNDNDGIGNACDSTPDGDTIGGGAGATTLETRVSSRYDDAEEFLSNNAMYLTSSDLELTAERSQQLIGLRFTDLSIPQGAVITNAYIQFQADETGRTSTNLTIAAHDTNSASAFSNDSGDISQRPRTTARATWQPPAWNTVGEAGSAQRTTNLAAVVQEVVNRSGWNSGNDMAFIISGTGKRVAESYEGSSTGAPLLHVEYQYK